MTPIGGVFKISKTKSGYVEEAVKGPVQNKQD